MRGREKSSRKKKSENIYTVVLFPSLRPAQKVASCLVRVEMERGRKLFNHCRLFEPRGSLSLSLSHFSFSFLILNYKISLYYTLSFSFFFLSFSSAFKVCVLFVCKTTYRTSPKNSCIGDRKVQFTNDDFG